MALPVKLNRRLAAVTALPGEHPSHLSRNHEIVAPTLASLKGRPVVIPDQRMSQRAVATAHQCELLSHQRDHPVQVAVIPVPGARLVVMNARLRLSVGIALLTGRRVQHRHHNETTVRDQIPVVEVIDLNKQSSVMVELLVEINRPRAQGIPDVHKDRIVTNRRSRVVHKRVATLTVDALPCQRAVSTVMNGAVLHASRLPIGPEHPVRQTAG